MFPFLSDKQFAARQQPGALKAQAFRKHPLRGSILFLIAALVLVACSPVEQKAASPTPAQAIGGALTPYASPTVTASPLPQSKPARPTALPSPTPTPRTHTVKAGEDMGGIAYLYHISVADLMKANPKVDPHAMSIGTVLIIPPSASKASAPSAEATANPSVEPPTPTPMPVEAGSLTCARVEDGGVWCFQPVRNNRSAPLESLSAVFHLSGSGAKTVVSQTALLPLDRLLPGVSLPLAAYFPPEQTAKFSGPFQFSSELLTSLPSPEDGRYLPTRIGNQKVMLAEDGLSASITAEIQLVKKGKAQRVWVAATAYDAQGKVVGVRRWEKKDTHPLESGQSLPISINIYSVSGQIQRVELAAEARP